MSILIVEDQPKLAENIQKYLVHEHYQAVIASDGEQGLRAAQSNGHELVILDLNLPKLDGSIVCEQLRAGGSQIPILMLTARATTQEVVSGLRQGADDYLTKPFALPELLARVEVLLRRVPVPIPSGILSAGTVTVDTNRHVVVQSGVVVELAPREFALLVYLLEHRGVVQDRLTILEEVWGEQPDLLFSQTVDVHIAYLRRKLGKDLIQTVPGSGYFIN